MNCYTKEFGNNTNIRIAIRILIDKKRYDSSFEINDHVTYYNSDGKVGKKKKFNPKWRGIWVVTQKFGTNAVQIKEITTNEIKKVNVRKIKRIHWHLDQRI